MAQQGKRKQAPAYSADTMALRYIAGLALAALGVLIFMAVDLNMPGNIFQGLRQVCVGATGSLAYVLAVLPLVAGEAVEKLRWTDLFAQLLGMVAMGN